MSFQKNNESKVQNARINAQKITKETKGRSKEAAGTGLGVSTKSAELDRTLGEMSLRTELDKRPVGARCYKYAAPNGAHARMCAWFAAAWLLWSTPGFACGPFFPNTLLDGGDAALLRAPTIRFDDEIERMKLVPTTWLAKPSTNPPLDSLEAELSDLRAALQEAGVPAERRGLIVRRHREERETIEIGRDQVFSLRPDGNRIPGVMPDIIPGLPGEFADYFRGAIAWHQGDMDQARTAWTGLLKRPPTERHWKSTWAAFMLGKSWEEQESKRAISFFQQVRALAKAGYADSLGLAASSLGWEGRLHLQEKRFVPAIDLYLEQAAGGEPSAVISLRWAAARALAEGPSALRELALHARAQRVITAYVIAGRFTSLHDIDGALKESALRLLERASTKAPFLVGHIPPHTMKSPYLLWLEAVEAAHVKDVESAEKLALAAYQSGEMVLAQRWLSRAEFTPAAQWLQAKLLLREGKVDAAGSLLAGLCRQFPIQPPTTNAPAPSSLVESLYIDEFSPTSAGQQVRGELGAIQLARREYAEALDALMHSGYWMDAAYVAERVLTGDELKRLVDLHWPERAPSDRPGRTESDRQWRSTAFYDGPNGLCSAEQIRYLLARRLARENRRAEARAYYPEDWRPEFDRLAAAVEASANADLAQGERAKAYFEAAKITRKFGLELIGTELAPDWATHGGQYEEGVTAGARAGLQTSNIVTATADELERAGRHAPSPDTRFHYRYTAAALAWEAAKLMPNNSDDTARALCLGGSWIKHRDPKAADRFYKSLVRRCRKTPIGAEADRIRWFPLLDAEDNLLPRERQPLSPQEQVARMRGQ